MCRYTTIYIYIHIYYMHMCVNMTKDSSKKRGNLNFIIGFLLLRKLYVFIYIDKEREREREHNLLAVGSFLVPSMAEVG